MNRLLVASVFLVGLLPSLSSAVEIKNIRPVYAPFGATRYDSKCLPGDILFITFEIDGLKIDAKTGKANYETILELVDSKGKVLFKNPSKTDPVLQLGGTRMPGDLHVVLGANQAPGQYSIQYTVRDLNTQDAKKFTYKFTVLEPEFGFVGVSAPAVGFLGQQYVTGFALVNMKLDGKNQASGEVVIRILDEQGKPVVKEVTYTFPRDLPPDTDLTKANFVPLTYPVFLNRTGRFTVEIQATDKNSKSLKKLSYPVTVLDVGSLTK